MPHTSFRTLYITVESHDQKDPTMANNCGAVAASEAKMILSMEVDEIVESKNIDGSEILGPLTAQKRHCTTRTFYGKVSIRGACIPLRESNLNL